MDDSLDTVESQELSNSEATMPTSATAECGEIPSALALAMSITRSHQGTRRVQLYDREPDVVTRPSSPSETASWGDPAASLSPVAELQELWHRVFDLQEAVQKLQIENNDLKHEKANLQHQYVDQIRAWRDRVKQSEREHRTKILQMQERNISIAHAGTPSGAIPSPLAPLEETSAWFRKQERAWDEWARAHARQDPDWLTTGLGPLQRKELCSGVKGFVQLTNVGNLPPAILSGGAPAVGMLLRAALAHFVCFEIFASPFWLFEALPLGNSEAAASSHVATPTPTPTASVPGPMPSASAALLPREGVENLYRMLSDAEQVAPSHGQVIACHGWRAQTVRLFAHGGMGLRHPPAPGTSASRHALYSARRQYACRLKDAFLGDASRGRHLVAGPVDPEGMWQLTAIIDDALRLSLSLWSLVTPIHLMGWKELNTADPAAAERIVDICQLPAVTSIASPRSSSPLVIGRDGHSIIMVVQPAVGTVEIRSSAETGSNNSGRMEGTGKVGLVWLRAQVAMAAQPLTGQSEEAQQFGDSSSESEEDGTN